jgi:hypothetical protein
MGNNSHIHTSEGNNECYTPAYAVEPLLEFLEPFRNKTIWCPFDKATSEFVKVLQKNNFRVVYSHIDDGQNFMTYEPPHWDLIVTNPPFTCKRDTFKRCLGFKKPFALLMTVLWLNDPAPIETFMDYNAELQLLMFDKRIEYMNQPKNKKINFKSIYYCVDFLPSRLEMVRLKENREQAKLF